jgi:hypothetical protein
VYVNETENKNELQLEEVENVSVEENVSGIYDIDRDGEDEED